MSVEQTRQLTQHCYILFKILPPQTAHCNYSPLKKEEGNVFPCRVGGLERFEMPHVDLIVRVETESIKDSLRNLLSSVSQS